MQRLFLAALVVLGLAVLPAAAQRGGGGSHGGFAGHAGGGFSHGGSAHFGPGPSRAGFAAPGASRGSFGRPGYGYPGYGRTGYGEPRYGARNLAAPRFPQNARFAGRSGYGSRFAGSPLNRRPAFFRGANGSGGPLRGGGYRNYPGRYRYRDSRFFFLSPVGFFPTYFDTGFLDPFWDNWDSWDAGDGWDGSQDVAAASGASYPASGAYADPNAPAPDPSAPGAAPYDTSAPISRADAPPAEDAVTILFKDGRPAELVRNYALTRTTLLIAGRRTREIPLSEIDLPATEAANRRQGVDFQPPQTATPAP